MNTKLLRLLPLAAGVLLLVIMRPAPAYACTPPAPPVDGVYPTYTVADQVKGAEIIMIGTVDSVDGEFLKTAKVTVQRYLKGSGPPTVTIDNFGLGSMCLRTINPGQNGVIYTTGDPYTGLHAYYYAPPFRTNRSPIVGADPLLVAQISAAAGQDPFIPMPEPESEPTTTRTGSSAATSTPQEATIASSTRTPTWTDPPITIKTPTSIVVISSPPIISRAALPPAIGLPVSEVRETIDTANTPPYQESYVFSQNGLNTTAILSGIIVVAIVLIGASVVIWRNMR